MLGGNSASVVIYQETMMGLLAVRFFSRGVCVGVWGGGWCFHKRHFGGDNGQFNFSFKISLFFSF